MYEVGVGITRIQFDSDSEGYDAIVKLLSMHLDASKFRFLYTNIAYF